MERVINRMYEIEEKANDIINRTAIQKQRLLQKHNDTIKQLKIDIDHDSEQKLSLLKRNMEKDILRERTNLTEECAKDLTTLQQNYEQQHDVLVEQVFQKIITL